MNATWNELVNVYEELRIAIFEARRKFSHMFNGLLLRYFFSCKIWATSLKMKLHWIVKTSDGCEFWQRIVTAPFAASPPRVAPFSASPPPKKNSHIFSQSVKSFFRQRSSFQLFILLWRKKMKTLLKGFPWALSEKTWSKRMDKQNIRRWSSAAENKEQF